MNQPILIETPRLVLREFQEADFADVHSYANDPAVVRFLRWGPNTEQQTRDFLRLTALDQKRSPRLRFDLAVVLKSEQKVIGAAGLHKENDDSNEASLGYCYSRRVWGKGVAPEAARALVGYGFEKLGLRRVWAFCDPANPGSARVLEKAGMRREGHLVENLLVKGKWCDSYLYAVLQREWPLETAACQLRVYTEV